MSGKRKERAQTACARCGDRFARPADARGGGNRLCEGCLEEDAP